MSGCKELPKQSVIGMDVSAPLQNGIYFPGVVRSVAVRTMEDTLYTVEFEDGYIGDYVDTQIVGAGLQHIRNVNLKFNQRVYTNHDGHEVCGFVQKHRKQTNEVFIKLDDSEETLIRKKLEDISLIPVCRKLSRLADYRNETRYLKFGDLGVESKKRTVTDGIEVPSAKTLKTEREEEPAMNEVMAAMILTSLQSVSPNTHQPMDCTGPSSPICQSISPDAWSAMMSGNVSPALSASSGHFSWDIQSRGTPSPGLPLSDVEGSSNIPLAMHAPWNYSPPQGTPIETMPGALMFSSSVDEGIDVGEYVPLTTRETVKSTKTLKLSSKTLYKCTWQGCTKTLCTVQGIERHIRTMHLGRKESEFSDHEEEFYYTELDSTMDLVSDTFASMTTSSPPPFQHDRTGNVIAPSFQYPPHHLSSMQCMSTSSQGVNQHNAITQRGKCNTDYHVGPSPHARIQMQTIPSHEQTQNKTNALIQSEGHRLQFSHPTHHHHHTPSPSKCQIQLASIGKNVTSSPNTKIRAEGRKCRKVYGMDNRNMWCTQCKWKKACVRFV